MIVRKCLRPLRYIFEREKSLFFRPALISIPPPALVVTLFGLELIVLIGGKKEGRIIVAGLDNEISRMYEMETISKKNFGLMSNL